MTGSDLYEREGPLINLDILERGIRVLLVIVALVSFITGLGIGLFFWVIFG